MRGYEEGAEEGEANVGEEGGPRMVAFRLSSFVLLFSILSGGFGIKEIRAPYCDGYSG